MVFFVFGFWRGFRGLPSFKSLFCFGLAFSIRSKPRYGVCRLPTYPPIEIALGLAGAVLLDYRSNQDKEIDRIRLPSIRSIFRVLPHSLPQGMGSYPDRRGPNPPPKNREELG
jgi:hypothetical protein